MKESIPRDATITIRVNRRVKDMIILAAQMSGVGHRFFVEAVLKQMALKVIAHIDITEADDA